MKLIGSDKFFTLDIKEENILLSIEDPAVLDRFVAEQKQTDQKRYIDSSGRAFYLSHHDLGPLQSLRLNSQLLDFDRAVPFDLEHGSLNPAVQPHKYRAPEVMLGTGWSAYIDIWNIGLVVLSSHPIPSPKQTPFLQRPTTLSQPAEDYDV